MLLLSLQTFWIKAPGDAPLTIGIDLGRGRSSESEDWGKICRERRHIVGKRRRENPNFSLIILDMIELDLYIGVA